MRFAFAGTPLFASWVLRELVEMGRVPTLVISQPDRPKGRGLSGSAPEAAKQAACLGLGCVQTDDINSSHVMKQLQEHDVDLLAVAAFGQLLKRPLLEAVMCVNIHASLLPRYRGAAPIERALMAGEQTTGVSIMRITEGLDEGPWAERVEVSVGLRHDAGSLARILAVTGAVALAGVFDALEDGTVRWTEQSGETSYAQKLSSRDQLLQLGESASRAHDQVRALCPALGARLKLGATEVKIWRTWPYESQHLQEIPPPAAAVAGLVGELYVGAGRLFLGCAQGVLEVLQVQPASKARMTTSAFLRGYCARLGPAGGSDCGYS